MLHDFTDSIPKHSHENFVVNGPRLVLDRKTGETMSVVERRAGSVVGARGPACLLFSTDRGFTRLWDYPADWHELTDAELISLSQRPRQRHSA